MVVRPCRRRYAPLLAVEAEPNARRARIEAAIAAAPLGARRGDIRASRGIAPDGTHVCVIVVPLYLQFVQILSCRYTPAGGFISVRHDPMRHADSVSLRDPFEGVPVEPTPLRLVVEELAHAVLADKREQRETPPALASFVDLFAPDLDDVDDAHDAGRDAR